MKGDKYFYNAKNDEFDLLEQTVALQLGQLPLQRAVKTEELILSTIRKRRFKIAKVNQTSSQQNSSLSILDIESTKTYY